MIVSVHQPAYLPWLGYFEKINNADIFVFLDTVQFEKNSFINRNKIKTSQGSQWLTIPVVQKGHVSSTLYDTLIDDRRPWRTKHLKSIEMNYGKAPYFKDLYPKYMGLLNISESNLTELCWWQLQFWLNEFQIEAKVVRASALHVTSKKSELILDLCKYFNATQYLSGPLGRNYLDEDSFASARIEIRYQDFQHPVYPQLWGDFEPNMGIVDYWMNCGSGKLDRNER